MVRELVRYMKTILRYRSTRLVPRLQGSCS